MGVFPSGQWGQTVNLLLSASVVRIHPRPPRTPVSNGYRSFCFVSLEKGDTRVDSNSCGAVAEDSAKTAQWAVFSSAARAIHPRPPKSLNVYNTLRFLFCDEVKLIERVDSNSIDPPNSPAGKKPLRGFFRCAARVIHPRPPKNRNVSKYAAVLFFHSSIFTSPACQSSCARILF